MKLQYTYIVVRWRKIHISCTLTHKNDSIIIIIITCPWQHHVCFTEYVFQEIYFSRSGRRAYRHFNTISLIYHVVDVL